MIKISAARHMKVCSVRKSFRPIGQLPLVLIWRVKQSICARQTASAAVNHSVWPRTFDRDRRVINHVRCFNAPIFRQHGQDPIRRIKMALRGVLREVASKASPNLKLARLRVISSRIRLFGTLLTLPARVPEQGVLLSGVVEYQGGLIANHPRIEKQTAGDERPYRVVWTKPGIGVKGNKLSSTIEIRTWKNCLFQRKSLPHLPGDVRVSCSSL
jgi:hypothetical protein